jgi:hypothetical protein
MLASPLACWAGDGHRAAAKDGKGLAIRLVTFGTSIPRAQAAFTKIEKLVKAAYPKTEVRWAYTSKIIRRKLVKECKVLDSLEIALAKLIEEGYKQPASRRRQFLGPRNGLFLLSGIALARALAGASGCDQTFLFKEGKIFVHRR